MISIARSLQVLAISLVLGSLAQAQSAEKRLRVYFVDVEGGQSTLFVAPSGQSLLIDTGWPGNGGRDADRILEVAKKAGLTKIDYVLITHYHVDHVGGVPQLLARIPVGTFIDHGPSREPEVTDKDVAEYLKAIEHSGSKHIVAHVGEVLPIEGMSVKVMSADGEVLASPLPGAGKANPYCDASELRPADTTENARSLGTEITFGRLKILDLGDLTWDKERPLMCPVNKIGLVDVLVVSHHGWKQSSSPALVYAIHPRVAIMDNGAKKGGSTPVLEVFKKAPGLETMWQLHYSDEGGPSLNTDAQYIANPQGVDSGHFLELDANPDGSFEVVNPRTGYEKSYAAKR